MFRSFLAQLARMAGLLALAVLLAGVAQGICGDGTVDLGEDCDDSNTVDGDCCSSTCTFESSGSPCSGATLCRQSGECDGTGTCDAVPRTNCRTALKSKVLLIDNNGNDAKDKLKWKWGRGEATTLEELGVPTATTNYALCIYAAGSLIEEPEIAADPLLWRPAGSRGYKYKDRDAASDGIQKVRLGSGDEFRPKMLVKGKGVNLPDPALDLPLPVTIQLVNSSNICFESVFDAPSVRNNNTARFNAKTP
jgi:cysteine-rich repeat protein